MRCHGLIQSIMQDGKPRSCAEIGRIGNCHHDTVRRAINRMNKDGVVHILRWTQGATGTIFAEWVYGPGKNAERPKSPSRADQRREKVARARKLREEIRARELAIELASIKPFRDPLTVAFYGEYQGRAA